MRRKTVGKKARAMPGKEQILDAAGRLSARHGFYGISVRGITQRRSSARLLGGQQPPSNWAHAYNLLNKFILT